MLNQVIGWEPQEVQVYHAKLRRAWRSEKYHGYCDVSVVYGRKPESTEGGFL
jgi:hypothetical protein